MCIRDRLYRFRKRHTVRETVRHLCRHTGIGKSISCLLYTSLFEVIIVNDGRTDITLQKMIEYDELVEVPYAYIERIKTKPFKRLLKSTNPQYSRLIVVDKEKDVYKRQTFVAVIK